MRTLLRRAFQQRSVRLSLSVFALATFWVWQRYAVMQSGDRILQLRTRVADLTETRDVLLAETTTLSSRNRIEALAMAHLGLRPAADKQRRPMPLAADPKDGDARQAIVGIEEGETTSQ